MTEWETVVTAFIIAPLTIAFWSSAWSILSIIDGLINDRILIVVTTVTFGFSISLIFTLLQKQIQAIFVTYVKNDVLFFLGSRLYTYLFGVASVCVWYCMWLVVDSVAESNWIRILAVIIISYFGLLFTGTTYNIKATPFTIATDNREDYFAAPTYFQSLQHGNCNKLILPDVIFSVIVVGTLVPAIWKGTWFLLDQTLKFADEDESSNFLSLVIGYFVALVTYFLQSPVERRVEKMKGWKGLIILDIYTLFTYCGTINIWRGVWNSILRYTTLDKSLSISTLVHFGSFLLLVMHKVSNTLLIRGVMRENMDNIKECVELPTYYRSRLQEKRGEDVESSKDMTMYQKNLN